MDRSIPAKFFPREKSAENCACRSAQETEVITTHESAQAEFASIVGAAHVVSDEATCRTLGIDGLTPKSVIYPKSPEQVAAVLKCAAGHDLAVIPCRSATKVSIGNLPRRYDVALSLKELNN